MLKCPHHGVVFQTAAGWPSTTSSRSCSAAPGRSWDQSALYSRQYILYTRQGGWAGLDIKINQTNHDLLDGYSSQGSLDSGNRSDLSRSVRLHNQTFHSIYYYLSIMTIHRSICQTVITNLAGRASSATGSRQGSCQWENVLDITIVKPVGQERRQASLPVRPGWPGWQGWPGCWRGCQDWPDWQGWQDDRLPRLTLASL